MARNHSHATIGAALDAILPPLLGSLLTTLQALRVAAHAEATHDSRVALRQLRSALSAFAPVLRGATSARLLSRWQHTPTWRRSSEPARPSSLAHSVNQFARRRLRRRYRKLMALSPDPSRLPADIRHSVRIEAKKLNTLLQLLRPVTRVRGARSFAKTLSPAVADLSLLNE